MSVEALVISALIGEGTPKKAFQGGVSSEDFEIHDEEWEWIVSRAEQKRPINSRHFKKAFPEFEFIRTKENVGDLIDELKRERAYVAISSVVDSVYSGDEPLSSENAIEKAIHLREVLGDVLKLHAPNSDVLIKGGWEEHYQHMRELQILRELGQQPGIPTGIAHFDHHWGGLQGETGTLILGRPGDAKSFTIGKMAAESAWAGYRAGMFSPEMTKHQHWCRLHTLLSAKDEVQKALGLKGAFRNRALKDGYGFNLKSYHRFLKYLDEQMAGEILLFTQKYRREKMTVGYIRTRVEEYGLDVIFVDPIYKLKPIRHRNSKWEELQEIVDQLMDIAHEFNIPVVMSNQASRALQGKRGEAPDKDSSFGADAPVQEADTVVGVRHYSDERLMKYNCSKNRHGEPFKFSARFVPNVGVLKDITPIKGDYFNGYDEDKAKELLDDMNEIKA